MRFAVLILFLFLGFQAHSEYRVFVLKITKQAPPPTEGAPPAPPEEREVISNLDPEQYRGYYPVRTDEQIRYTRTWTCPGRTSNFLPYCPDPNTQVEEPQVVPAK